MTYFLYGISYVYIPTGPNTGLGTVTVDGWMGKWREGGREARREGGRKEGRKSDANKRQTRT